MGGAWTRDALSTGHMARLRWVFAIAVAVNLVTWTGAALAFVLGGDGWGAAAGLLALLTLPLLGLPAAIEFRARLRARRHHRVRPPGFPSP